MLEDQTAVAHMKTSLQYPELFIPTLLAVIFLVPVLEETLFRGFLQTALAQKVGAMKAIIITAALFALFHFSEGQGVNNINILVTLFVFALFLGFVRERQGNLWPSIALHAFFNAISVLMIFLT